MKDFFLYIPNMLRHLWSIRQRISVRMYFAFGTAVVLTFIASILAIVAINLLANAQRQVNEQNVPKLLGAFTAAQLSSDLVSALPRMIAAGNETDFRDVVAVVEVTEERFINDLNMLEGMYVDHPTIGLIKENGEKIYANIAGVKDSMNERFKLLAQGVDLANRASDLQNQTQQILIPAIDDQLFYAMTSYRQREGVTATTPRRLSQLGVSEYRHLVTIHSSLLEATRLVASVRQVDSLFQVPPLRQEFDAAINRINRALTYIQSVPDIDALTDLIDKIAALGQSADNSFATREQELEMLQRLNGHISENRDLMRELVKQMEELVNNAKFATDESTQQSRQVAELSEIVLIGYNVLTIVGAVLIAWLWVGRQLIDRIAKLSDSMQTMAEGDLEVDIDETGADEVAHMASALEVFRKHAIEVQRLNLVEKLANELSEKNETLESTNQALRQAQEQIVMREKLAALGELTAGVAHEIKNPMNFIINFSDVSKELVAELVEEVELAKKQGDANGDDDKDDGNEELDVELLEEICEDLTGNLERIVNHGQRANRIVMDMLNMGRGNSDWRAIDLNELIESHGNLAFHGVRGQNSEVQLKLDFNLDENIGEVNVTPQDLGRVILNVATNAAHATHEKRLQLEEEKGESADYMPTLAIASRKTDEGFEIEFKDNGPGMSDEVLEKIFQPFFTTKDPNSGTGLGMSLSYDIMRQHGGDIRIETKLGEGSTLTLVLPPDPGSALSELEELEQPDSNDAETANNETEAEAPAES